MSKISNLSKVSYFSVATALTLSLMACTSTPNVTLSLSSSDSNLTTAKTVTLTATPSGTVAKVAFYEGSTLLGIDSSAPYTQEVVLTSAQNGSHSYNAKAMDAASTVLGSTSIATPTQVTVNIAAATVSNAVVTTWRDDAKGAYTIGHDDYCDVSTSGLEQYAIPALNTRGLKASFGVIAQSCDATEWTALKTDAAQGHEIVNHTLTHIGEFDTSLNAVAAWNQVTEIKNAHDLIKTNTGVDATFAVFPFDLASDTTRSYVQSLGYLGMRAAQAAYNGKPAGHNASSHDLNGAITWGNNSDNPFFVKWDSYDQKCTWSLYEASGSAGKGVCPSTPNDMLIRHAQNAIDNGTWNYNTIHGVADTSWQAVPEAQYIALLDFLKSKVDSGELWVATPSDVLRYRASRTLCALSQTANILHFDTSNAECVKYAGSITVKLTANNQPSAVQNGLLLPIKAANTAQNWYLEVNPKLGDITLN